jgi:hypothetical protein
MTKSRVLPGASLCGLALLVCASAHADVFINEFHYDNSGTDTNEKIEVIAPAGTNLAGWSIVLYTGSGGASYATLPLSGTTTDQCGGHGTVVATVGATGLQNGAPDGFALVNASSQVVQFLSYEGTFAATGGPASGMTSTAIAQSETDSTLTGQSLRLTGTGSSYSQFTWAAAATSSFGACNAGQTLSGGTGGSGNVLTNNSPIPNLAATTNNSVNFFITVPTGASNLVITTTGGTGDADLYVRFGSQPTTTLYTCRSWATGNNETCSFPTPQVGNYHVMVRAYTSFTGVTLRGSYSVGTDTAPTLLTTHPANGATNVPVNQNITVPFSEAVTLLSGWFSLNCSATGAHTAVVSAGPVNWSLNPNTDFGPMETCTLSLVGANVRDQDGTIHSMTTNPSVSFTTTGAQTGYYAGVVTTSASALRSSLHPVIDDSLKIPYTATTTDTWDALNAADQDPLNSGRILDIYKNTPYTKSAGGNDFYNREHTWPNSLGFPSDGSTNYPYTDVHMLMASDITYNSNRGNKPLRQLPERLHRVPDAGLQRPRRRQRQLPGQLELGQRLRVPGVERLQGQRRARDVLHGPSLRGRHARRHRRRRAGPAPHRHDVADHPVRQQRVGRIHGQARNADPVAPAGSCRRSGSVAERGDPDLPGEPESVHRPPGMGGVYLSVGLQLTNGNGVVGALAPIAPVFASTVAMRCCCDAHALRNSPHALDRHPGGSRDPS